jgi:hypothetical protein
MCATLWIGSELGRCALHHITHRILLFSSMMQLDITYNSFLHVLQGLLPSEVTIEIPRDALCQDLLRICRVMVLRWSQVGSALDLISGKVQLLSLANEAHAVRMALSIVQAKISAFNTSMEACVLCNLWFSLSLSLSLSAFV